MNPPGAITTSSSVAAWTHSVPVVEGLLAQYDPSDSGSLTLSAGDVTYIRDLATGYNAYKDSNYSAPSISSGLWNGLDVLDYDYSNEEVLALPWIPIEGSDPRFIWIVAKSTQNDGTDRTAIKLGPDNSAGNGYFISRNNSNGYMEINNDTVTLTSASGFAFSDGPQVYGINHDGSSDLGGTWLYYGTIDDSSLAWETFTAPGGTDDVDTIQSSGEYNLLGTRDFLDDWWGGQIAEVLIYDRNLTNNEKNEVFSYLRDKWLTSADAGVTVTIIPSWMFQPRSGLNL